MCLDYDKEMDGFLSKFKLASVTLETGHATRPYCTFYSDSSTCISNVLLFNQPSSSICNLVIPTKDPDPEYRLANLSQPPSPFFKT